MVEQRCAAPSLCSLAQHFSVGFLKQGPGVGKGFSSILIAGLRGPHHLGFFTANRLKSTEASLVSGVKGCI